MRYQHGCYQVSLRHYGFSLFEFVIVLALVAVLFSAVKREGSHFFDYDVKTGNVVVTSVHR